MCAAARGRDPLPVGRCTKPAGLRGELRVNPYNPGSDALERLSAVLVKRGPGLFERRAIERLIRLKGSMLRLKLAGIDSIEQAQQLAGCELLAEREDLPEPPAGSVYWNDLIGLSVVDEAGCELGRVTGLFETGANDVIVIERPGRREALLPNTPEVVRQLDLEAGRIVVRLIPGLLDED